MLSGGPHRNITARLPKGCRRRWRPPPRRVIAAALSFIVCGCGSGDGSASRPPLVAVLSAFPAELAPHLERVSISDTIVIEGHVFRVGLEDHPLDELGEHRAAIVGPSVARCKRTPAADGV